MDALGGHVSESSESSHSPLLERHEFSSVSLGSELFANPHNFNAGLLHTNFHYTINVPTLDNQGPAVYSSYIDRMQDGSHPEGDDHPDSISEEFHDDGRSFSSEYQSEGDDSSSAAPYEEAEKHTPIGSQHQVDLSVIDRAIEEDSPADLALRGGTCVWDPRRPGADDVALESFLTATRLAGEWNFYEASPRALGAPDHTQVVPMETAMFVLHRNGYNATAAQRELELAGLKWHACRPDLTHWTQFEINLFESAMERVDYKEELNFAEIQRSVKTKNYHEVVEFYWYWKKALRRRAHRDGARSGGVDSQSLLSLLANEPDDIGTAVNMKRKREDSTAPDFVSDSVDWDLVRSLRPPSELMEEPTLQSRIPMSTATTSSSSNHVPNHDDLLLPSPPKRRKTSDLIGGESLAPLFSTTTSGSSPTLSSSIPHEHEHGPEETGSLSLPEVGVAEVDSMIMFDDTPSSSK